MIEKFMIISLTLLVWSGISHAQLYSWTDEKGETVIRDYPQPYKNESINELKKTGQNGLKTNKQLRSSKSSQSNSSKNEFDSVPGDEIDSVIRVFTQTIKFPYPKEWGLNPPVFKNEKDNHFIIEFIPKEQKLNNWKDMLTIQGFKHLANNNVLPEKMLRTLMQQFNTIAPTMTYSKEIYQGKVNGYSGIIMLMGIKELPKSVNSTLPKGVGEIGLYLALKGKNDMYIVHRSWKSDSPYSEDNLPMSQNDLNRWIDILKRIKLI
jgi:hypothetical protein